LKQMPRAAKRRDLPEPEKKTSSTSVGLWSIKEKKTRELIELWLAKKRRRRR